MATARDLRDVRTKKNQSRRSSAEFMPPYMSELRIVLLGRSGGLKSKVGNIILGRMVHSVKDQCERAQGLVNGRPVALINTPDLLDPELPDRKLFYQIERCVSLSAPGPHALLLVLESSTFTKEDRKRLKRILGFFSDQPFKYSALLLLQGRKKLQKDPVEKVVRECRTSEKTDKWDSTRVTALMANIQKMVKKNGGGFLRCEMFKEPESAALEVIEGSLMGTEQKMERKQNPQAQPREQQQMGKGEKVAGGDRLNLVLFGRSGAGKTSAGNAILGQRESSVDPSSSSVCERREGEVCGCLVTMVEMPALCESQLSASTVSRLCASLCGHGVHAFLLVIPAAPLTDEDKAEITGIQEIFGSRVTDYMMVLFTHEYPDAQPVLDILQQNEDTRVLLEICSNRFCVFNNQDIVNNPIVPKLLKAIEEMNIATESCFSLEMYLETQLEKVRELEARHKTELEEKDRKIRELEQNIKGTSLGVECEDQNSDCVRIVLVGKTGSGKSATGNTILQREGFLSEPSSTSVTTLCKKEVGEVAGRRVAVVDTPGLFDTGVTNEEVQQEMAKCISFLAPGPHVFLIVLQIGRFTKEEMETLQLIKSTFGKNAEMFTIVMFTRGDDLIESIEQYIQRGGPRIQNLIKDCGNRFHVFNNKDKSNHNQVSELLDKIDSMVNKNGGGYYTNEMFQEAEMTIKKECERILREKEEEVQREKEVLKAKHEEEIKEMQSRMEDQRLQEENKRKCREKELKDKEEHLRKERKEWKKREQEEKERKKKKKEKQELEWKRKMDKIEKEKSRIEKEWKCREDEEKNRVEREEKQRQEMIEKQSRERKEFEEKQAEEKKKRDREEQERKYCEERERREWEQKMKDVEKEKKEIQEDMKKRAEEWEQERKIEQIKKEEEEKKRKQKEEQERREWDEKQKKMRDEFEKEREQERQRRVNEMRDKEEMMERDLEEKKRQLKKQQDEWDKERKEDRERRDKEDVQRREEERKRLARLQEDFEREREAENQKRKMEDQARREREDKECKEMRDSYERRMEDMKRSYKELARDKAEESDHLKNQMKEMLRNWEMKHARAIAELFPHRYYYSSSYYSPCVIL